MNNSVVRRCCKRIPQRELAVDRWTFVPRKGLCAVVFAHHSWERSTKLGPVVCVSIDSCVEHQQATLGGMIDRHPICYLWKNRPLNISPGVPVVSSCVDYGRPLVFYVKGFEIQQEALRHCVEVYSFVPWSDLPPGVFEVCTWVSAVFGLSTSRLSFWYHSVFVLIYLSIYLFI